MQYAKLHRRALSPEEGRRVDETGRRRRGAHRRGLQQIAARNPC